MPRDYEGYVTSTSAFDLSLRIRSYFVLREIQGTKHHLSFIVCTLVVAVVLLASVR